MELVSRSRPLAFTETRSPAAETERIYALPDLFLGNAILKIARAARAEIPQEIAGHSEPTRERFLLFCGIPELARRLGVTRFEPGEIDYPQLCLDDDYMFRFRVTSTLMAIVERPPNLDYRPNWNLLIREVTAGNVVAIALDRLCPPETQSDALAAKMSEAWKAMGRTGSELIWSPEMRAYSVG